MPHDVTADELGIAIGTIALVTKENGAYIVTTSDDVDITDKVASYAKKNAFRAQKAIQLVETRSGGTRWNQVSLHEFNFAKNGEPIPDQLNIAIEDDATTSMFETHEDLVEFIHSSISLKPKKLKIDEKWWRYGVRSVLRGENLLVVGPSGCGKTLFANSLKVALSRQDTFFYINLGSTQDPRSTLIGNTHFDPDRGTFVALSYFAHAIQVPNALILLDEVTRAHPEAWNILMTVLDHTQRYLRVDEKEDTETIRVAPGVAFVLTANIGSEYTSTRTLDRALMDRCTFFDMHPLNKNDELENLKEMYPGVSETVLEAIASVAAETRREVRTDTSRIETIISTRACEKWASLVYDGFTMDEGAEMCVYPHYTDAGGADSPRCYVKQVVQKYLPNEFGQNTTPFRGGNPRGQSNTPWAPINP